MGSKLDQLRALREARHRNSNPFEGAARSRDPFPERKQPKAKADTAGDAGPVRRSSGGDGVASRPRGRRTPQDAAGPKAPPVAIQKRGRGRPKIEGKRPWEAAGISMRTYYRRKAEGLL